MELKSNPSIDVVEFTKALNKALKPEEVASVILTLLGMSTIFGKHMLEMGPMKLPNNLRYALIQLGHVCKIMSKIALSGEPPESIVGYMPEGPLAWKSDNDFYQRYKFVVKAYYEHLVKQGEI